jgi:hypothetical protein
MKTNEKNEKNEIKTRKKREKGEVAKRQCSRSRCRTGRVHALHACKSELAVCVLWSHGEQSSLLHRFFLGVCMCVCVYVHVHLCSVFVRLLWGHEERRGGVERGHYRIVLYSP